MRALVEPAHCAIAILGFTLLPAFSPAHADETWVRAIRTSSIWASFPCKDLLIAVACGIVKEYGDPGVLPPVIKIGDTIEYTDKEGAGRKFRIEAINFFVFEKDVFDKNKLVARRGETSCFLFDSKKALRSPDHLSKIVVKRCVALQ